MVFYSERGESSDNGMLALVIVWGIGLVASAFTEPIQPQNTAYNNKTRYECEQRVVYVKEEVKKIEPLVNTDTKKSSLENRACSGDKCM